MNIFEGEIVITPLASILWIFAYSQVIWFVSKSSQLKLVSWGSFEHQRIDIGKDCLLESSWLAMVKLCESACMGVLSHFAYSSPVALGMLWWSVKGGRACTRGCYYWNIDECQLYQNKFSNCVYWAKMSPVIWQNGFLVMNKVLPWHDEPQTSRKLTKYLQKIIIAISEEFGTHTHKTLLICTQWYCYCPF